LKTFEINGVSPVLYHLTGKFEAPSERWMHAFLPLHDYELFVMTEGTMYLEYANAKHRVEKGEILLLPPVKEPGNLRKGYESSYCCFYWMHFALPNIPPTIGEIQEKDNNHEKQEMLQIPQHIALPHPEKVIVLMKQLQDAVRMKQPRICMNYLSMVVLCEIYGQVKMLQHGVPQEKKTQKQIFNDIVDYIRYNIHARLTVVDIAKHFGYNEKYISQMFRKSSGITLKQYLLKTTMDEANFFLTDTNFTVTEIAEKLGFQDSHNFMKCYKKVTGITPSEYRNAFSKRLLFHE